MFVFVIVICQVLCCLLYLYLFSINPIFVAVTFIMNLRSEDAESGERNLLVQWHLSLDLEI